MRESSGSTPEQLGNVNEHSPIQKRILKELRELSELEKLDPTENKESRAKFLSMFKWTDSKFTGTDCENLESTIVEFNDIFARHRLDIGMNTQFEVSLSQKTTTCQHPEPSSPNQPQRVFDGRINPHASLRHHNDPTILQIRQPHIRPTGAQRQT